MKYFAIMLLVFIGLSPAFLHSQVDVYRLSTKDMLPVKAGSSFSVQRKLCIDRDMMVRAYRRFVHTETGLTYTSPRPAEYFLQGGSVCKDHVFLVEVPDNLPKGDYTFEPIASYTLDGEIYIQSVPSEKFTIH